MYSENNIRDRIITSLTGVAVIAALLAIYKLIEYLFG